MNNIILVHMDEAKKTNEEQYIIGTVGLATCTGILLYSRKKEVAIVAHVSNNYENTIINMLELISDNKLDEDIIEYKIIKGSMYNQYQIDKKIETFFKSYPLLFKPMNIEESSNIDKKTDSKEFLFDTKKGIFVTNNYNIDEVIQNNNKLSI